MKLSIRWTLIFLLLLLQAGCSSFQKNSDAANYYLRSGDYEKACELLKPLAEKDNDDQLVYLLDYGMCLHLAGKYDESIQVFLKADDIAAIKDYTSLSREAGSILLNEGMVQYKGDDFEKIFIHVYLALNFLMKNDIDSGLVEARRVNEILIKYRDEGKRDYDQNHFAMYLSAIMWEAQKYYDDAYIAYAQAYKYVPGNELLKKDLLRSAKLAQRSDEYAKWKTQFPGLSDTAPAKTEGELVIIYQQGIGPKKEPNPHFYSIPTLVPQRSTGVGAQVQVAGKKQSTKNVYNVQDVAMATLKEQFAVLLTKRIAGKVAKYAVANQVGKEDGVLGAVAWIGLNVLDQADLRQWSNLPATFQVARINLPSGEYKVKIASVDSSQSPTGESKEFESIQIKPGKKTFLTWRSFR